VVIVDTEEILSMASANGALIEIILVYLDSNTERSDRQITDPG